MFVQTLPSPLLYFLWKLQGEERWVKERQMIEENKGLTMAGDREEEITPLSDLSNNRAFL